MLKTFNITLSIVNTLAIVVLFFVVARGELQNASSNDLTVRELRADRVFVSDRESNGYIELAVDGNGPLLTVSNSDGTKATTGAVKVKEDSGVVRTTYPAFSVSDINDNVLWIVPASPDDAPDGRNVVREEVLTGSEDDRIRRLLDIHSSLKDSPPEKQNP